MSWSTGTYKYNNPDNQSRRTDVNNASANPSTSDMKPMRCHSSATHRAHVLFSDVIPTSIIHFGPTSVSGISLTSRHYVGLTWVLDIGPISIYLLKLSKDKHENDFLKFIPVHEYNIGNIDYETDFIQKTVQYCIPSHNWWFIIIIVSRTRWAKN